MQLHIGIGVESTVCVWQHLMSGGALVHHLMLE